MFFVTKLSPSGSLVYSTFLGGSGNEHAGGIAVDSAGNAYIAGGTYSTNFPALNAIQSSNGGGQDAFVTKINPSGSALIYSTYFGGIGGSAPGLEQANAVAVDPVGNAYAVGETSSPNFPVTTRALRTTPNGLEDAFVIKLNGAGSGLIYSTYLGGSGFNSANAVSADANGNAYVGGSTASADFPRSNPIQTTFGGGEDAFIAAIGSSGSSLFFSTLYGGRKRMRRVRSRLTDPGISS